MDQCHSDDGSINNHEERKSVGEHSASCSFSYSDSDYGCERSEWHTSSTLDNGFQSSSSSESDVELKRQKELKNYVASWITENNIPLATSNYFLRGIKSLKHQGGVFIAFP